MKKILPKLTFALFLAITLLFPLTGCLAEDITTAMLGNITGSTLQGGNTDFALRVTGKAINAFLSFFGVIFLCLMIYGGYKWMMAAGRDEEVKKSQEIIRAAIIGLVIVIASYAISFFITYGLQKAINPSA